MRTVDAALILAVGLAAAPGLALTSSRDATPSTASVDAVEDPEEEALEERDGFWGFVDGVNEYYPIILDRGLEPEVDEKVVWLWITTAACGQLCGPLWIPMLVVGEYPGDEYYVTEALWAIAIAWLTTLVGGVTSTAYGLGSIIIMANLLYFSPVSLINTYDRALKKERARTGLLKEGGGDSDNDTGPAPVPDKKKKNKKKKKRSPKKKSAATEPALPLPAAYAAMAF